MSQISGFPYEIEEQWQQRLIKLQKQLLDAKHQQANLKRINNTLQETIKNAIDNQTRECQSNSIHRANTNLSWREKYELEAETNIENQKYIRVLQKKRNTISIDKRNSKNRNYSSTKLQPKNQNQNNNYHIIRLMSQQPACSTLSRNSSVKKMQNFMGRLMKQKYQVSEFGSELCMNYKRENQRKKRIVYEKDDLVQRMFGSVKQIQNQPICSNNQEQWTFCKRSSIKQNNFPSKSKAQSDFERSVNRKLHLTSHLR